MSAVAASLLFLFAALIALLAWVGRFWFCRSAGCTAVVERGRPAALRAWSSAVSAAAGWLPAVAAALRMRMRGRRRSGTVTLPLLLPLLLPLVVLLFLSVMRLVGLSIDGGERIPDNQIVSAVLGEPGLLAPPVLPPSAFAGEGALDYGQADRDWSKLDPNFRGMVFGLLRRIEARGFAMTLVEGYRTPARQEILAADLVKVTQARGFESRHQYGLAVDLAPLVDGQPMLSEQDARAAAAFRVLGEEAEAMGLIWGGRWSFRDLMHVEAPGVIRENMAARVRTISAAGR